MTADELYELVKDDPEVWGGWITLDKNNFSSLWFDSMTENVLCSLLAEVALEALYARATGCGVVENGVGTFDAFDQFAGDEEVVWTGPTRLSALVTAYRASKENKR